MAVFPDVNESEESSSSSSTLDETNASAPETGQEATSAASSPAPSDEGKDTLSVVRDVVAKSEEKTEPAAASQADGENGEKADDPNQTKEVDDENFSDVPFSKHARFKALIKQRNELREDAGRYRNVQTFIDSNGLTGDEAANILISAAKAKTDPVACLQEIRPWLQKLLIAAGEVLPDDLSARVNSGEITHEAAIELSRTNARLNSMQATQSFQEQQRQQRAAQEQASAIQETVSAWENDRTVKDPNFSAKYPLILKELKVIQHDEGKPNTPRGVQEQLQRAYQAANASFRPPAAPSAPARKPMQPVRGGAVNGAAQSKPETTLDVIRAVRAARAS